MKKAIIFDLDGTLWDSTYQIMPAWNRTVKAAGIDRELTHKDMCRCMGKTADEIGQLFFPTLPQEQSQRIVEDCCANEIADLCKTGATLYPALRETLTKLHENYHLYIVSNCEDGYIQSFLSYHDFEDLFEDFECIGVTGKPKGENIKLIIERNHIDKAIYVGDTLGDYKATQIAGIPFVHANYGFGQVENVPQLERFSELCAMADEMLK